MPHLDIPMMRVDDAVIIVNEPATCGDETGTDSIERLSSVSFPAISARDFGLKMFLYLDFCVL